MDYESLNRRLGSLIAGTAPLSALSNAAALLYSELEEVSWVGFYILRGDTLVLGPFQGKPACVEIKVGRGVCGSCVASSRAMLVDDVLSFPGHIACDPLSRSEIVVPVFSGGDVAAVLDIDSYKPSRFTEDDECGLTAVVETVGSMFGTELHKLI